MKNDTEKLLTYMISLVLIASFSTVSLSITRTSTKVDDFSVSVPNLSAQDTYWPPNSSNWVEVAPETQGLDSDKISEMFEYIEDNSLAIQNVIIVRNGYLLTYEYLHNSQIYRYIDNSKTYFGGETLHEQYSTTKSLMSILIGIALQEGFIDNLNQTLYEFFADIWEPSFVNSTLKKNITIEQLLTMTSGYGYWPPDADIKYAADSITFNLAEVPLGFTPGEFRQWAYNGEGPDLLSGIITKVTGKSAEEFAKEYLFTPLRIAEDEYYFDHDAQNISYGGSGFECTPKVQAKLGILCLNNGTWEGTQIIDKDYLKDATTTQSDWGEGDYGYLWWIRNGSLVGYNSEGAAGQNIYVIPEYNLVVCFTGTLLSEGGAYETLLLNYIIPFTEPEGSQKQIPGIDFNMIIIMIFCISAVLIIKRKIFTKN
ncbi:MAG: serine hydrolase domain-containing protein [Candidatus Hodarchaeales archaeon]|jgi:CubicO group peptidase (beta-lactamase class C family)